MQVPILSGIYTSGGEFRAAYPVNMVPVPKQTGINTGYLRPAEGIALFADTGSYGLDRGGMVWDGVHYRCIGQTLVNVGADASLTSSGVGLQGSEPVRMAHSFDRLAIASGGELWYYFNGALSKVTDPDLGTALDVLWVDGYFLTTDGDYIVQTELQNPAEVNPVKYGSSEANPDRIVCLRKIRREVYAVNRYTTEVFQNVGGSGFAFQVVPGAQIERGCVGVNAAVVYQDAIAMVGGGAGEPVAVYLCANGQSIKLSSAEVDTILAGLTESEQSRIEVEARTDKGHAFLMIHLPGQTLVYDASASKALEVPAWHVLSSSVDGVGAYNLRRLVYHDGKFVGGHPGQAVLGCLSSVTSLHFGQAVEWAISTQVLYNDGRSAIVHSIDLECLTGFGVDPAASPLLWTSYSHDGLTWSQERSATAGKLGQTTKRIQWRGCGQIRQRRIQRITGASDTRLSVVRLDMTLEPLSV